MMGRCDRRVKKGQKVNLSHLFARQTVGVTQVDEQIWLITFMKARVTDGFNDEQIAKTTPSRSNVRRRDPWWRCVSGIVC
jgi:hypothetical protein